LNLPYVMLRIRKYKWSARFSMVEEHKIIDPKYREIDCNPGWDGLPSEMDTF